MPCRRNVARFLPLPPSPRRAKASLIHLLLSGPASAAFSQALCTSSSASLSSQPDSSKQCRRRSTFLEILFQLCPQCLRPSLFSHWSSSAALRFRLPSPSRPSPESIHSHPSASSKGLSERNDASYEQLCHHNVLCTCIWCVENTSRYSGLICYILPLQQKLKHTQ